jgi:hypothetical protein
MTDEERRTACAELSFKIAQFYDDVEDPTVILWALIPLVAQSVLNVAYERQVPTTEILKIFGKDLKGCTVKMHLCIQELRKTEGTAQ